jgi:hypothetical protein
VANRVINSSGPCAGGKNEANQPSVDCPVRRGQVIALAYPRIFDCQWFCEVAIEFLPRQWRHIDLSFRETGVPVIYRHFHGKL